MNINDCINSVELFNEIAGNLDNITNEKLIAQAKVVAEEGNELLEAVAEGKPNDVLKECVDVLVTIHGFVKMLEAQGHDIIGAWNEVNVNNLSKFPTDEKIACDTVDKFSDEGIFCTIEENKDYNVFVIKNENGKVVKPIGYKKCSVASYTPKGILPKVKLPEQGGLF